MPLHALAMKIRMPSLRARARTAANALARKTARNANATKTALAATVARNASAKTVLAATVARNASAKTVLAVDATKPQMRQKPKTAPLNIRTKTARITQSITANNFFARHFLIKHMCINSGPRENRAPDFSLPRNASDDPAIAWQAFSCYRYCPANVSRA